MSVLPMPSLRVVHSHSSPTIYLIEDEEAVRMVMECALRAAGYNTQEADDPETAIRQIAGSGDIDLVLADFGAVRASQFQARLSGVAPDIPLLLCSGMCREDILESEWFDPATSFLQKPFHLTDLIRCVDELLKGKRRARLERPHHLRERRHMDGPRLST